MDSFITSLQPILDFMNTFRDVAILVFVALGVFCAFFVEAFVKSLLAAVVMFAIAHYSSSFIPGAAMQVSPYFWAGGIGLAIGSIVKWSRQRMIIR